MDSEIIGSLVGLAVSTALIVALIWGFVMYIKVLVDAAKTEKWGWFVLMLLMWPIFFIYLNKEYKSSPRSTYRGGRLLL
jgi:hypothetical protein